MQLDLKQLPHQESAFSGSIKEDIFFTQGKQILKMPAPNGAETSY